MPKPFRTNDLPDNGDENTERHQSFAERLKLREQVLKKLLDTSISDLVALEMGKKSVEEIYGIDLPRALATVNLAAESKILIEDIATIWQKEDPSSTVGYLQDIYIKSQPKQEIPLRAVLLAEAMKAAAKELKSTDRRDRFLELTTVLFNESVAESRARIRKKDLSTMKAKDDHQRDEVFRAMDEKLAEDENEQ